MQKRKQMKIAIDCRLIGQSGIGTYIQNLVAHAVNISGNSYVLIGNIHALESYAQRPNCIVVDCRHKSFTLQELFSYPTKEVNQCDAFFTPNFNIPWGIRVPIFSTIHDVVFFDVDGICSPLGKLIRWMYIKRALSISKTVLTVSHFSEERIRSLFNYRGDVQVVYNGIGQELKQYRQEYGCKEQKGNYIVYLGNLKKYKGIKDLTEAYHKARATGRFDCRLLIIGRKDARTMDADVLQLMEQHDDDIEFVTDADNFRLFQLLSGARALVSPSHYEGFGIPPLEAMYLGTPAIVSDIPTHREIYQGTPAIFFHCGDSDDLAEKLMHIPSGGCNVDDWVENKYNFMKTAETAIRLIEKTLSPAE